MNTDKRQLRLTISSILESHNIDDLALETKLVDAIVMFFDQTGRGIDSVKVRGNILDGMLSYLDKQRQYEQMAERITKACRVSPDGSDNWNEVIRFCIAREKAGETIEKYGEWMIEDKFNSPKVAQISMKPLIIKNTWVAAFIKTPEQTTQAILW
jgi:hypothetical protein